MITLIKELTGAYMARPSRRRKTSEKIIKSKIAGKVDEIYTDTLETLCR